MASHAGTAECYFGVLAKKCFAWAMGIAKTCTTKVAVYSPAERGVEPSPLSSFSPSVSLVATDQASSLFKLFNITLICCRE
jgi:hypothetical protein